jgi:hypothetical protein
MSEQIFQCEVIRNHRPWKSILYVAVCALMGIGLLAYVFFQIGLENLVAVFEFVMSVGVAIFLLLIAYVKGNELWEIRNTVIPQKSEIAITDQAVEHRFGLTTYMVPLRSIDKIHEPSKSGEPVGLTLMDGSALTLPVPKKEREFLAHLKSKVSGAT